METTSVIITATSTLLGVAMTLYFTYKREKSRFIQDILLKNHLDLKGFLIDMLASIERAKRYTEQGKDYDELLDEISNISARAFIIAPDEIVEKLNAVSDSLYIWSSYYRKGLPSKLGNTGIGIYSSNQNNYSEKAEKHYPEVLKSIEELIITIKRVLNYEEERLGK